MAATAAHVGLSIEREEDNALLSGRARFMDDVAVRADTLHAAFVRSSHAHANILSIDLSATLAVDGVVDVLCGDDIKKWSKPFVVGVKQPMEHWSLAVDRVRYVGEPIAMVLARDRYAAEDGVEEAVVDYAPLSPVLSIEDAIKDDATIIHPDVGNNVVSERHFNYGDPDEAFAKSAHHIDISISYPRNACTPMECMAVLAEYKVEDQSYDVLSNFQGPFALHPVMALALQVQGGKLRLRAPPFSGGSFGVKQAAFPYIVALSLASRKTGKPVKWVEDRLEHLEAATSATGRRSKITAAVNDEGVIDAFNIEQFDDCGGYLRAPEPASLYRMHGNLSGAYKVKHIRVANRVVLTNKTPAGLNRGFGGPQLYFLIERLIQKIARTLNIDHLDVINRNLVPSDAFPYRTPSGGLLDSGDYSEAVRQAVVHGHYKALVEKRATERAAGKIYGIGMAAVVEPSVSNMGYISTALSVKQRKKAGPKNGAHSAATVALDPLGTVIVSTASLPQGQGHATVLKQVVADVFGLDPKQIVVNLEFDTQKDAWSIAAGNYSSRFGAAVAGTAHLAATKLRKRLTTIAAKTLNVAVDDIVFCNGKVSAKTDSENNIPFARLAGSSHWSPATLPEGVTAPFRETAFWSMPQLEAPNDKDEINSSGAYGFIFDYCGVELDKATGRLTIDRYVTMHDAGKILHPALVDGQIQGGFAHAVGAALYEEFQYAPDGGFLSGTFADYLVPTTWEVPDAKIIHMETPSPFTPLGAKGVGEGNCMSTPVCLANAVADALGIEDVKLPMTPSRLFTLMSDGETEPEARSTNIQPGSIDGGITGRGEVNVQLDRYVLWDALLDPLVLAAVIPGCHSLDKTDENAYRGDVTMGVGPVRGRFDLHLKLTDLNQPHNLTLHGTAQGALGVSKGTGLVKFYATDSGTRIDYEYGVDVSGKVAAVGGRMIEGAAKVLINQFFKRLVAYLDKGKTQRGSGWLKNLGFRIGSRR